MRVRTKRTEEIESFTVVEGEVTGSTFVENQKVHHKPRSVI